MTNGEHQKLIETHHILPIINYLSVNLEDVKIGDKPDVIIRNYEGKVIGVENVEYHPTQNRQRTDKRLTKICKEYEDILRERGEVGFFLNVHFSEYAYSVKRLESKEVIEDIEYSRGREVGKRFVWYSMRSDILKDNVRVLRMETKIFSNKIDYSTIKTLIEKKERKLTGYKQLEKNKFIDEYWLNINIPFNEGVIYKPDDTLSVESDYTRIYLSTYELGDTPLRIK
ncbi:MAG: hypothetical protein IKU35_10570 [Bacteroidaceae bacterium]|nr:hypothetical protein [Bacteroidaceae bacterium]